MAERILVALDGSTVAEQTLPYAALLATCRNADLLLARAVAPPPSWVAWTGREHVAALSAAEAYFVQQRERLASQGIPAESAIATGGPAGVLLQVARDHRVALIVMASHGRTTIPSRAAGAVTEHVLAQAPCPVLLLTPRALEAGGPERLLQRVLVAVDRDASGGTVTPAMLPAASRSSTLVTLVYAAPPLPRAETVPRPCFPRIRSAQSYATDGPDMYRDVVAAGIRSLQPLADEWRWHGLDTEIVVEVGEAADVIVRVANRRRAGIVVMSRRGRGWHGRLPLGSTAMGVLRQIDVPVLVDSDPREVSVERSDQDREQPVAAGRGRAR